MNLNVFKGLLAPTQIKITTASSGTECLDILAKKQFDIVLLDHMMPEMDGIETNAIIKEKYPNLPVYALTANNLPDADEFYKSNGFRGYLSKPIDSFAMEATLMKHLGDKIIQKPAEEIEKNEPKDLPDDMLWIRDVDGIDVDEGIKNSGGVSVYMISIKDYFGTIDFNADAIEEAYNAGDIKLYTVKVHALKTSARIVGAMELSALAEALEDAGKKNDLDFINENTGKLLSDYRNYKTLLSRLEVTDESQSVEDKEPIDPDELASAYEALKELVQQMLLPVLDTTPIRVTVEYAEAEDTATVTVVYGGERFDPQEGENELSYRILSRSVEELTYTFDPAQADTNTVRVRISEKQ